MTLPDPGPEAANGTHGRPRAPGHISIAFLTGLVLVPVVVAAGLLADRHADLVTPNIMSGASLRGAIDVVEPMPRLRGSLPI